MQTSERQSVSRSEVSAASSTAGGGRSRREGGVGWRVLLLSAGFVPLIYALGLGLTLLAGSPASNGAASWPDMLAYPLALADPRTPLWLDGSLVAALVVALVACALLARRSSSAGRGQTQPVAAGVRAVAPPAAADPVIAQPTLAAASGASSIAPSIAASAPSSRRAGETEPRARPAPQTGSRVGFVPRIFISHASADNTFGHELARRLRVALGDEDAVWYDSAPGDASAGLVPGDEWWDRINAELDARNVFLIILSPASMGSKWCQDELKLAWSRKNSKTRSDPFVLIPLKLQTCEPPKYLTTVQFADFTNPNRFEENFARLLQTIRAGRTVEQPVTTVYGPPFDLALLPLPAHFVGREKELTWLREQLATRGATAGIVAVNGMGGIGKTGLAAKAIHDLRDAGRFADGIAVVSCQEKRGEADALQILSDVLTRFDPERRAPEATDLSGLAETAGQLLGGKDALVVLDNVEPELPVARVVAPLREAGASLLLTARQTLPADVVPPEGRLALDLLSEEEALDLLARSLGRPAALDLTRAERDAAERIVRNLGRLTLAVTLAGAYAADLDIPLEKLAAQLEDPQRALKLPQGEAPDAVKRVFASSYAALPGDAQRLFDALAAIPTGEFGRDLAEGMARAFEFDQPEAMVDLLVRRALATTSGDRLQLHPLIRAFAEAEFAAWPEDEQTDLRRAVAKYYADYANETSDEGLGPDEANIEGALEWVHAQGEDQLVARLCNGMKDYWRDRSKTREQQRYLPWGLEAAERIAKSSGEHDGRLLLAYLHRAYGELLLHLGKTQPAADQFEHELAIAREVGAQREEGIALGELADIQVRRGDLAGAQASYEQYLAIMREVGDRREEGVALSSLGEIALRRGDLAGAQANNERALANMQEVGDRRGEGVALGKLGEIALRRGDVAGAQDYYERELAFTQEVGDRRGEGVALAELGRIMLERGDLAGAQAYCERYLAIMREVGDRREEGAALTWLGRIARQQGRFEQAEQHFEQAVAIDRELGDREGEATDLRELAELAEARGQAEAAARYRREAEALETATEESQGEG